MKLQAPAAGLPSRMRRLPLVLALVPLLASGLASAYHGEPGGGGWFVAGPASIDGMIALRAQPGVIALEGPADARILVEGGVASVTIEETRTRVDPVSRALGREVDSREARFEMPRPAIRLSEVTHAFAAALATDGGVAGLVLEPAGGVALAREEAGAPAAAALGLVTAEPGVRALAAAGVARADGESFTLHLTGAVVSFRAGGAEERWRLGSWVDEDGSRVRRVAVVAFRDANVAIAWTGAPGALHAPVVDVDYEGTARLAGARGAATVNEASSVADGADVAIGGILSGSAWPASREGSLRFEAEGDVTMLAVGAARESFLRERAAVASVVVLVAGAVAALVVAAKTGALLPLYARITGGDVMDHAARDRAFEVVKAKPGASVLEVAEDLDVAWSTAAYHLAVLEREGFIAGERRGRHRRFFAVGSGASREEVFATEHPTARRILETVRGAPGVTQKEIAAAAGVSASTASWHLERLAQAGLVVATREWRAKRYQAP